MSEILKEAFARPNALTQNRNYGMLNHGDWPKYVWELYPLAQTYYHEFNPYFVHLIKNETIIPEFSVFTVRDGVYAFADFLVKNARDLPKWKTSFIIPDAYSALVPDNIRSKFLSYSISQSKAPDVSKAKSVTVFSLLCDQYFGDYEKIAQKLSVLKDLPKDARIDVCLSQRKNPLFLEEKENLHFLQIPEIIRKVLGNREIRWIRMRDLFEKTVLKDNVLIDLLDGNALTCDSYLHYWWLSRGGSVNVVPVRKKEETLFDIDISFYHRIHVRPLTPKQSRFADLMFISKTTRVDLFTNPIFHSEVDKILTSST